MCNYSCLDLKNILRKEDSSYQTFFQLQKKKATTAEVHGVPKSRTQLSNFHPDGLDIDALILHAMVTSRSLHTPLLALQLGSTPSGLQAQHIILGWGDAIQLITWDLAPLYLFTLQWKGSPRKAVLGGRDTRDAHLHRAGRALEHLVAADQYQDEDDEEMVEPKGGQDSEQENEDKKQEVKEAPPRELTEEEKQQILHSEEFLIFFDRTIRVIERALAEDSDIFFDYSGRELEEKDGDVQAGANLSFNRQFYDEHWSKHRVVTCMDWSLQYPELMVASYNNNEDAPHEPDGVALVWNMKFKKTTPEYVFHCQVFEGHQGPVTGINCHMAVGPIDFSHLFVTSSFDWTVKLWTTKGSPLICTFKGNSDHVWEQEKLGKATYKKGAGVQGRNDSGLDQYWRAGVAFIALNDAQRRARTLNKSEVWLVHMREYYSDVERSEDVLLLLRSDL
ncbi:hypothetical protein FD755_012399 [Muntiacus reevesi]|uniref:Uncharacterized protein n=1 Tax=Muntiacus reevesi TaxID=9886 RepID=A0A5N3XPE5_MUNRE|nr:hypothetical protein FD755_012399 [Muntiacus reevesi]